VVKEIINDDLMRYNSITTELRGGNNYITMTPKQQKQNIVAIIMAD
jgi:hypothetical protein